MPLPRAHQVLYRGVLAPHAAWRKEVVIEGDAFRCPMCSGRMELRCVVQGRAVEKVLRGLQDATGPP